MKQTSETAFEPDWLGLREPADHAARDQELLARAAALAEGATVLDLGGGTGSTARAFSAAGHRQLGWRIFDNDPVLLQAAERGLPAADCIVGDLTKIEDLPFQEVSLITASALLDLMSEDWVTRLVARSEALGLPIYAALNYSGHMSWTPSDPRDDEVVRAFNTHQRRDKGTGPALGPTAGETLAEIASSRGWEVHIAESPWQLGAEQRALHETLLDGIAEAAHEAGAAEALAWGTERRATAALSTAVISHQDVLAIPVGGLR